MKRKALRVRSVEKHRRFSAFFLYLLYPIKLSTVGKLTFLRWKTQIPPEGFLRSSLGIEQFLRWNCRVPPLELKNSTAGTKKFQGWNRFGTFTKALVSPQEEAIRSH